MSRKWVRFLLIEAVVVIGLWFWWTNSQAPEETPPVELAVEGPGEVDPNTNIVVLEESLEAESESKDSAWFPEGALAGEVAVRFANEAQAEAWMKALREMGVGVQRLAGIDQLWMRFADSAAAEAWLQQQGLGPNDLAFNYPVNIPINPVGMEPTEQIVEDGFLQSLFDVLGIPADNSSWGEGVLVAVLDTGVVALDSLAHTSVNELSTGVVVDTSTEAGSHGTSMAHLIAGADDFARGVAPSADLLSVPVLNGEGAGSAFDIAAGIVAAVDGGAQVINLSLGSYGDSAALADAVAYAVERGAILVAAAGNDGAGQVTYPAAYSAVIAVGAYNPQNERTSYSNYGYNLDFLVPGNGLLTRGPTGDTLAVTGTSGGAAIVSGIVASMLSDNPSWDLLEVTQALESNTVDLGPLGRDIYYGTGLLRLK